jgi:hypothetical protein
MAETYSRKGFIVDLRNRDIIKQNPVEKAEEMYRWYQDKNGKHITDANRTLLVLWQAIDYLKERVKQLEGK